MSIKEPDKPYLVAQERTTIVDAPAPEQALLFGEKAFSAYSIADNPDVKDGAPIVRSTVVENLPMMLNLADSETVLGRATLYKDEITGNYRLDIQMFDHAATLMDHLVEIADLKAVGFAGVMKRPEGM
jgi:hypothetical protein